MMNRRSFFTTTACAGATLALAAKAEDTAARQSPKKRIKLGVCTYSYWHFRDPKVLD